MAELPVAANWVFDVKWCRRNPELVAASSFDGSITISTLSDNATDTAQTDQVRKLQCNMFFFLNRKEFATSGQLWDFCFSNFLSLPFFFFTSHLRSQQLEMRIVLTILPMLLSG